MASPVRCWERGGSLAHLVDHAEDGSIGNRESEFDHVFRLHCHLLLLACITALERSKIRGMWPRQAPKGNANSRRRDGRSVPSPPHERWNDGSTVRCPYAARSPPVRHPPRRPPFSMESAIFRSGRNT